MSDVESVVSTSSSLQMYDSPLYRIITNERDCALLQQDLDRLQEWEKKWQMACNADKCEALHLTKKKHPFQQNYFIHGQKLATKSEAKYLGVTISSDLSWSKHVANISKKASKQRAQPTWLLSDQLSNMPH